MATLAPMLWDQPIPVAEPMDGFTQEQSQAFHNLMLFQESFDLQDNYHEVFPEGILNNDAFYVERWNQMGVLPHCDWCAIPFHPGLYPGVCSSVCHMRRVYPHLTTAPVPPTGGVGAPSEAAPEVSSGVEATQPHSHSQTVETASLLSEDVHLSGE